MTGHRSRIARTTLAATLSASLLLAGCGGDDREAGDGATGAASSSPSTASSAPADPTTSASTGGADGGATGRLDKATFFATIAAAQKKAGSFRATGQVSLAGITTTTVAEARYDGDEVLARSRTSPKSGQQIESVLAHGVVYLRGSGLPLPTGKWLKIDPDDEANANSPLAPIIRLADPQQQLTVFGTPKDLTLVGSERVEGVDTSHYRVTIDATAFARNAGLPGDAAGMLPPDLTIDLWLDDADRPVRMRQEVEIDGRKSLTEQVYSGYGDDVTITVPADADTVTPSETGLG